MTVHALTLNDVSFKYPETSTPTLSHVNIELASASFAVVIGPTGAGKSTLLGVMSGSVPHFTGGTLTGEVSVLGQSTRHHRPRDFAGVIGVVGQDPLAGFVQETVEDELVYGMEQLGLEQQTMRTRLEETIDFLGLEDIRDRRLQSLSGGQQQRVAIGAVLTAHPQLLLLDEPTSALDQASAEDVLAILLRLVHDLAITVVLAEHRLERVLPYADMVIEVERNATVRSGMPTDMMETSRIAPPVVELGRMLNWHPLPLTVRDARRFPLPTLPASPDAIANAPRGPRVLEATNLTVCYNTHVALDRVNVCLHGGETAVLMGRNGAGKSSLLWALQGSRKPTSGEVRVGGERVFVAPGMLDPTQRRHVIGLVPQAAADLLYLDSVEAECQQADRESGAAHGATQAIYEQFVDGDTSGMHPRDLSEGQRLCLVLAIQLVANPKIILLDEPTRGLDYAAKHVLCRILRQLAQNGKAVLVATHDIEFAALIANRVMILADGELIADGLPRQLMTASPTFAPQIAKVLSPAPILTFAQLKEQITRA